MLKKIISISLIITMILSFTTVVFAEGFSDVDETKYSWAVTQINDMAEKQGKKPIDVKDKMDTKQVEYIKNDIIIKKLFDFLKSVNEIK